MKRTLLAGAVLFAAAASPAHAVTYSWQGDLFVTGVNDANACGAVGLRVGAFARGVFRPKNLGTNGTSDFLAWHFPGNAGHLQPNGGSLNAATLATIRIIYGSGGFKQITNNSLTGATVTPANPPINQPTIKIVVTINNAYPPQTGSSNCNATFTGTLAKRPN
jgi:hypothetical protein